MRIEFMGVTGTGKSTLATNVASRLREAGHRVVRAPDGFVFTHRSALRAYKILHGAIYGITRPHLAVAAARRARRFVQPSEAMYLRLLYNWLYVTGVTAAWLPPDRVAILEQGLGQGLYTFAFLADGVDPDRLRALFEIAPRPDLVVFVQAPADVVRERIRGRSKGHDSFERRLLSEGAWMDKAMRIFASIAEVLDEQGVSVVRCDTHALPQAAAADAITTQIRSRLAAASAAGAV